MPEAVVVSGSEFTLRIDLTPFAETFRTLEETLANPGRDIMMVAAEELVSGVLEEFDTAGHGSWDPLAESTLKKRRGATAQILVDTGRMRGGIHAVAGDNWAEAAADADYAKYHVSEDERSVIPLRNFFDIQEQAYEAAIDAIIDGSLEQAGFR